MKPHEKRTSSFLHIFFMSVSVSTHCSQWMNSVALMYMYSKTRGEKWIDCTTLEEAPSFFFIQMVSTPEMACKQDLSDGFRYQN